MQHKKWFFSTLFVLLVGVLILGSFGCAKPAPAPAPAPKPAPAPAPAPQIPPADAKPITIQYIGGMPPGTLISRGQEKFKEIIENKSKGVITAELYPAGQLYKHKDMPEALQAGATDMAVVDPNQWSGTCPAGMAHHVPLGYDSLDHLLRFVDKLAPIFSSELKEVNAIVIGYAYYGTGVGVISKEPIRSQADFDGKKLRAMGEVQSKVLGALGAKVVVMSSSEVYTALQRGTVDAAFSGFSTFVSRKWMEPAKYVIAGPNYTSFMPCPYPVLYDLKKWNALPGWAQDIIKESVKESYEWALTDAAAADKRNIATLEENGVTFYLIPEAEWPEWTKAGKVGWDHIAERDKENGAAILKAVEQTR